MKNFYRVLFLVSSVVIVISLLITYKPPREMPMAIYMANQPKVVEVIELTCPVVKVKETKKSTIPPVATTEQKKKESQRVSKTEDNNKPETKRQEKQNATTQYSAKSFRRAGRIKWGGHQWTYYSQKVLPGKGLAIPGRHVDENGYVCDGDGYICLASNVHEYKKGAIFDTPFGKQGKVYDHGCNRGVLDVYVNW